MRCDCSSEGREESIKELLNVIINGCLHRQGGYCDAVNVNSAVGERGREKERGWVERERERERE